MKKLFYIIILAFVFISCKKENNELLQNSVVEETGVTNSGLEAAAYKWYQLYVPTATYPGPTIRNMIVQVNGKTYALIDNNLASWYEFDNNTKRWEPGGNIFGAAFGAFGTGMQYFFSSGTKIYWGMNRTNDSIDHRFFSTDGITGATIELSLYPGTPVDHPTCFAIGSKGYIMSGRNHNGSLLNQLWEYNCSNDTWTNKGASPIGPRAYATALPVGNKAYLGLGYYDGAFKNDWILYDPATNSSTVKASFPGSKREEAKGFVLGSSPYVGFGRSHTSNTTTAYNDFYRYNPTSNDWTVQSQWPSGIGNSYGNNLGLFAVGNKGYLLKGHLYESWCFSNTPVFVIQ